MLKTLEPYVAELEREAETTRKCFEQIPEDKMSWRPHPKSMSIGELAMHIAMFPGLCFDLFQSSTFELNEQLEWPTPASRAQVLSAFEEGLQMLKNYLQQLDEKSAAESWTLILKGQETVSGSRMDMLRPLMMSHTYHHRGQLTVYLRLLEVPVPPIYGPTADFTPFVAKTAPS
jgi:uncharacterized damage-inducible protein DinB